jgi:uncharacterized membrane protein
VQHRELRMRTDHALIGQAAGMNSVFLNAVEFADACRQFPIVFVRTGEAKDGKPAPLAPLAVRGRWSLSFYMVHQPVFFGLLTAWTALRR